MFLQVHLLHEQSVLQLHLTISRSSDGATSLCVRIGKYCPPSIFQPQSSDLKIVSRPVHCFTWKYLNLRRWSNAHGRVWTRWWRQLHLQLQYLVLLGFVNTWAWSWKSVSANMSFRGIPFPRPWMDDVESHPRNACMNRILITSTPYNIWSILLFQHLGGHFDPCFGSG